MPQAKVVRDSVKLVSGTMVARLAGLARGLGVPFFLAEAAHYGLWQLILVIWQYGMYLHLGSFEYLNRELPGLIGLAGNEEKCNRLKSNGLWGTIVVSVCAAVIIAVWPLSANDHTFSGYRAVVVTGAVGVIALQIVSYHILCFRSRSQFGRVSLVSAGMAIMGLPLGLGGAWLWGIQGLVSGVVLAISVVGFGGFIWNRPPAFQFSASGFLQQAREGLPLSLLTFSIGVLPTIGIVVSASFLGLEQAGYLGVPVLLSSLAIILPQTIGMVVYPRFLEAIAAGRDPVFIAGMFRQMVKSVGSLVPLVICCGAIVVFPVLHHLLPQYERSVPLCYVMLASSFFFAFTLIMMFPAKALRRQAALTRLLFLVIAIAIATATLTAILSGSVFAVVAALCAVNCLASLFALAVGAIGARVQRGDKLRLFQSAYLPGIALGTLTALLIVWPLGEGTMLSDLGYAALRLALLLSFGLPFAWLTFRTSRR